MATLMLTLRLEAVPSPRELHARAVELIQRAREVMPSVEVVVTEAGQRAA